MRWPWSKPETRASATDAVVAALVARAGGGEAGDANASGAQEIAAGLWARCFAAATVTPAVTILSASFLALVARNLARRGESVHLLDIQAGRLVALPVGSWDIRGDVDEDGWIYQLHRYGPSRSRSQYVSGAAVLHFRYATDPARPWEGISPLGWASRLAAIAGGTDLRLGEEAGGTVARLVPIPHDGGDGDSDPLAALKADIAGAKGRALLVETTSGGMGEGRVAAPQKDWVQSRIGPVPPAEFCSLRDSAAESVLAAHGISAPILLGRTDGTAMREGWRQLLHGTLRPVARTVGDELARKLDLPEPPVFDFSALYASDLAGRAQAFGKLVTGGMAVTEALGLAGLLVADDE